MLEKFLNKLHVLQCKERQFGSICHLIKLLTIESQTVYIILSLSMHYMMK